MTSLIKELSPAGPLLTLLLKMKKQVDSKSGANRTYKELYPILEELLAKGYSFESREIQAVVALLAEMPAWGARREKFKKFYLQNELGLRKLPREPARIQGGMWH
ncbi:hypothetical protein TW84_19885 [Vibrio neptunius]|uniref:hypothetical protein n=1 Tax=Vibrio neptunius TaxID=170651 RepID=UPI0005FA02AB|nr:hypothetical protein [Vibrio neptunius]KJY86358.1 hypothetical protein TW84_19885 [Vibrio neptunius]